VTWLAHVVSKFTWESSLSVTRTTPNFPTPDHTDPSWCSATGSMSRSTQPADRYRVAGQPVRGRQSFAWTRGAARVKFGGEFRANRDTTYFGQSPNGQYVFGGGRRLRRARSGRRAETRHQRRTAVADTLSGFLSGSAFSYTVAVAPPQFPQGNQIGVAAISRYNLNLYAEDSWRISPRLLVDYGLRFELYSPITERARADAAHGFVNGPLGPGAVLPD